MTGAPRSSKPVSLGNESEKPDHQSDPLFDLTLVLTFDLTTSGIPLIAGARGGQVILPKVSLGPGSTSIPTALWARMDVGYLQIPKSAQPMGAGRLSNIACTPRRSSPRREVEGGPKGYIRATQK